MAVRSILDIAKWVIAQAGGLPTTAFTRRLAVKAVLREALRLHVTIPSANQFLSTIRQAGIGIRTQDFYQFYQNYKRAAPLLSRQKSVIPPEEITPNMLPPSPFRSRQPYVYQITMSVYRYRAGEEGWADMPFWYSSPKFMQPDEVVTNFVQEHYHDFEPDEVDWSSLRWSGSYKGSL